MRRQRLTAGFNELKTEFVERNRTLKSTQDLRFQFVFENNVLSIHDSEDQNRFLILAVHNSKTRAWKIFLRDDSDAKALVAFAISKCGALPTLSNFLTNL
jgi:hypothetical protein